MDREQCPRPRQTATQCIVVRTQPRQRHGKVGQIVLDQSKVNVSMVGATVGAPFKNVTVEVPGTVIQFGGQDMGEF